MARAIFCLPDNELSASTTIGDTEIVMLMDGSYVHIAERGPGGTFSMRLQRGEALSVWLQRQAANLRHVIERS